MPSFSHDLIAKDAIAKRVRELGAQIAADLDGALREDARRPHAPGEPPPHVTLIAVMTGAMVFVADLIREMPLQLRIELVAVSSYPGTSMESKGVRMKTALPDNLAGAHVLLIDDILDSGHTLHTLHALIRAKQPASLRTCVLLRKPGKAQPPVSVDYVGFDIPDEFVVGYGLDYDGLYRNHPAVAVLKG
jgi:hypoxanthine phosphoribosyltransferase